MSCAFWQAGFRQISRRPSSSSSICPWASGPTSWARKLREAEEEAKILRDSTRRADEIASRYAPGSSPDDVSAERRKQAG
jgi:hypothetical protein